MRTALDVVVALPPRPVPMTRQVMLVPLSAALSV
jgi:hypothetical protein